MHLNGQIIITKKMKVEILKENKDKNNTKSFEDTETLNNKLIINKSIKHIIEELTKEEKRLLVYLENVKHAQIIILENKSIKHIVIDLKKEEKELPEIPLPPTSYQHFDNSLMSANAFSAPSCAVKPSISAPMAFKPLMC